MCDVFLTISNRQRISKTENKNKHHTSPFLNASQSMTKLYIHIDIKNKLHKLL